MPFTEERREARCTCGATCGLFFKADRWWCGDCLWAEVERLREERLQELYQFLDKTHPRTNEPGWLSR